AAEESMKQGTNQKDARRAVRLERGSVEAAKEVVRSAAWESLLETSWRDLCYALRMLRKSPGFAAIAILTLALGTGANTVIFSGLYGLVLRPLPYPNASRLVMLWDSNRRTGLKHITVMEGSYPILQREARCFDGMAAFGPDISRDQMLSTRLWGTDERIAGVGVTWQFFSVLGVAPILGRSFLPSESVATVKDNRSQQAHVAILSYAFWQEHYGASPNVLGKTLDLNEFGTHVQYVIVGVMPKGFDFPYPLYPTKPDIFVNIAIRDWFSPGNDLQVVGRLKSGVNLAQAQVEIDTIADRIRAQYPKYYKDEYVSVVSLRGELIRNVRSVLWVLLAAFSFILLIGCANAGNLLLVRAVSREREMAIRATLGAGRLVLIRQMLIEALLLGFAGGAVGLLLAYAALRTFLAVLPTSIYVPRMNAIALDFRVLIIVAAFSVLAISVFTVLPSVRLVRPDLNQTMKSGSFRREAPLHSLFHRPGSALLIFEVSLAMVLLTGTLLMLRSVEKLLAVNSQFQPEHLVSMAVELSNPYLRSLPDDVSPFPLFQQFAERVSALPGVESVALVNDLPLQHYRGTLEGFKADGGGGPISETFQSAVTRIVTPPYFPMMSMALIRGRWFQDADGPKSLPVAVINEAMAKAYWPNRDPLGLKVEPHWRFTTAKIAYTVVGIVREPKQFATGDSPHPSVYLDYSQVPQPGFTVLVRTAGKPKGIASALRSAALKIVPGQTFVGSPQTGDELIADSDATPRFTTQLLTAFACLALLLAVVGIYGLISYYTSRRTHEIGIRMALGAQRENVMRLVLKEGMGLAGLGVAAGIVASYGFAKSLSSLLYGVSATDLSSFAVAAVLFFFISLLASYIPARRAMRVDPMVALRYE
ncbi:MAG TPA: ABC transporter permease, partial [Candidatus Acidoferrales bacterium]|nr:ABC transporter permease [Candidatus Acidoferrales bacterium]